LELGAWTVLCDEVGTSIALSGAQAARVRR
jgi:hypothetical protein